MANTMVRFVIASLTAVAANALVTSLSSAPMNAEAAADKFHEYVVTQGRSYHPESTEYGNRHTIFKRNLELIQTQNSKPDRLWTAGLNELTDRTDEELRQLLGWRRGGGPDGHSGRTPASLLAQDVVQEPLESVDWRSLSMAHEVPNQGGCGSCWAVATASMLQGRHEAQVSSNRTFSAQQLVNCVPNPSDCGGSGGCDGATVELAMSYVQSMGLDTNHEEPYVGSDLTCKKPMAKEVGHAATSSFLSTFQKEGGRGQLGLQGWHTLPSNQALPLMLALADGPVAVSVGASDWSSYMSGVFNGCSKDSVINHAVVLFGYGQDATGSTGDAKKYWLLRNSWGGSWGENGFIRLLRQATIAEDDAFCGTDHDPKAGIACKPYPDSVKVCGQCGVLYDSVAAHFALPVAA